MKEKAITWMKKNWEIVGIRVAFLFFPFVLEWFLFITPVVSRFTNETWFSFIASYTGAIATFIVLRITLKENQKALENEKRRLRHNYEIEKELEKVKAIQSVLLLDKYDFLNLSTIAIDYARYAKDIQDIQYEVREIQFDSDGKSARDRYLNKLYLLERFHTLSLCVEKAPSTDNRDELRKYAESFVAKTSKLHNDVNLQRKEIMDLYKEYVHEMKLKEYE